MSEHKTEKDGTATVSEIIYKHRMHDGLRGDYEVPPYRKFITCVGCDWEHDIAGMSGWHSWVAKHAEHVAAELAPLLASMLTEARAAAWFEGHMFTGYAPERGENPYGDVGFPPEQQAPR